MKQRVRSWVIGLSSNRLVARTVLAPIVRASYRRFSRTQRTPAIGYSAMRKLHVSPEAHRLTSLTAHDRSSLVRVVSNDRSGFISDRHSAVVETLQRDGICLLESPLPEELRARLETLARQTACLRVDPLRSGPPKARFDQDRPTAVRYDVPEMDLVADPTVQSILADRSFFAIAESYLGGTPVQDLVAMWWTSATEHSSSIAAQKFHFDLDRLRFLKWFIYLTDVDADTGPHAYVRGSHVGTPLTRTGDRRYGDDEVLGAHGHESVVTITGAKGTMFLADTKGLHKGLPVKRGHRLVFQLEYASSLFGAPYARHTVASPTDALRGAADEHPHTFRRFSFEGN